MEITKNKNGVAGSSGTLPPEMEITMNKNGVAGSSGTLSPETEITMNKNPLARLWIFYRFWIHTLAYGFLYWKSQRFGKNLDTFQGFGSGSVSGSGSAWIRINLSCWIRIRIQIVDPDPDPGGQKWPTKIEKGTEFLCFEVLYVLIWGLKASPVAWGSFMEANFWSRKSKLNFQL
jgi:hypothetical protein